MSQYRCRVQVSVAAALQGQGVWESTLALWVLSYKQVGKGEASPQDPFCQACWTLMPLRHVLIKARPFLPH